MRIAVLLVVLIIVCMMAASPALPQSAGVKHISTGEFTDKDGSLHSWKINGTHTLIWDGQPYIPVGGIFQSRYVSLKQTEANWQADINALQTIKDKGITDLLLKASDPVTLTDPKAWQRLIDYLDSEGFTYGIDFADGPIAPLSGVIIEPTRYRMPDITRDTTLTLDMPNVVSAIWMLCSATDGTVLSSGGASVSDGKVTLNIKARQDQSAVLLLYPVKELSGGNAGVTGDLWAGFDEFRDRMVKFLSAVKFGKGLRFFADPVTSKMDFTGELESLVPDSPEFRLEFESYLAKKYLSVGALNTAWALSNEKVRSFQEAARLIPLWRGPRGVPAVYDRARGMRYSVNTAGSQIWTDIEAFRSICAQSYMNSAADIVKRSGANIPVIYKASRHHQVFANSVSRGGFDGLGAEVSGHGIELITNAAGAVYSLAEESARTMWFVIADTNGDRSTSPNTSETGMIGDLDYFREIGAKGIFVKWTEEHPRENRPPVVASEHLDWLKKFKERFLTGDRTTYAPNVIYYPVTPVVGANITRLAPDTWWLPSLRSGARIDFGDTIAGYALAGQNGICLWSRSGASTATFVLPNDVQPALIYPTTDTRALCIDKKKAVLELDSNPVLVIGLDPLTAFPVELAEAEIERLAALLAKNKDAGGKSGAPEGAAKNAQNVLKNGRTRIAYDMAKSFSDEIAAELGTYVWMEGEGASSHNFDGTGSGIGVSMGGYLAQSSRTAPPMGALTAVYWGNITKESTHEIWIACTTPEAGGAAFSYSVDGGPWQPAALASGASPYWGDFAWYKIGSANLTRGQHMLQIKIDAPGSSGLYKLNIDALVLSPTPFKPDGIRKP